MQPHTLLRRTTRAALALMLTCLACTAIAGIENPKDTPAIHAVHLDMALAKRVLAVNKARDALDDDPPLYLRTKDNHVPKTLDELVAEVHAHPDLEALLKRHGFTPREYLLATLALSDAGFGYGYRKSGETLPADANLSEAHIRFFQQHAAELDDSQGR